MDQSSVLRGENSGRKLTHVAVARAFAPLGALREAGQHSTTLPLPQVFNIVEDSRKSGLIIDSLDSNQGVGVCCWNYSRLRSSRSVECLGSRQEVMVRVGLPSVLRDLYPKPTSYVGQWVKNPTPKRSGIGRMPAHKLAGNHITAVE
jgi:hypothetical protein